MAFVRYKTVEGKRYYQVVSNYRERGKHRQEVLCHLGVHDSLEKAIEHEKRQVAALRSDAARLREQARRIKEYMQDYAEGPSTEIRKAYIEARRQEWREEGTSNGSLYEREYAKLKRYAKRWMPEWLPVVEYDRYVLMLVVIRYEEDLADKHRAKLTKLLEIQHKYF